jgi:hypothetical protein
MDNWSRLLTFLQAEEEHPLTPDTDSEGLTSTYTRTPAPYDKHLSPDLIPLHTKILDTLANRLVENAEAKIKCMQETHKAHPPSQLVTAGLSKPTKVKAEFGITLWYSMRAQMWCSIAAALGLHNGNWDWGMLSYTIDIRPHYALANGALVIDDDVVFNKMTKFFPHSIDDKQRAVGKMLRERTIQNTIISWEFKSLLTGSKEVMESIVRVIQSGSFQWTLYDGEKCERHKQEFPHVGCEASNLVAGLPTSDPHGSDYQDLQEKKAQNIIQQVQSIFAMFQEVGAKILHRSGPRLVSKI